MPRQPKYLAKLEKNQSRLGKFINRTFDHVAAQKKSSKWFANVFIGDEKRLSPSRITLFDMLYMRYKAKGYELGTLPFYDRNPLVMMLDYNPSKGVDGNGLFLGLNLHYLPPRARWTFLYDVMRVNEARLRTGKKPVFPYQWVKGRHPWIMPAIKSYIPSRVSHVVRLPVIDWEQAVYLKSSDFAGISQAKVISLARSFKKTAGAGNPKQRRHDKRQSRKSSAPTFKGRTSRRKK